MGTEGNVFAQKGQRSGLCFECLRTVCSTRWSLRKKRRRHRRHSKGRMPEWLSLCRRMLANCVKRMKQTSHSYERLSRAGVSSPDLLAVVVVLLLFISRTAAALVSALGVDTSPSKSILCDSTGWLCYLKTFSDRRNGYVRTDATLDRGCPRSKKVFAVELNSKH